MPALLLLLAVASCGAEPTLAPENAAPPPSVAGQTINTGPEQNRVRAEKVEALAAEVPAAIAEDGKLAVGVNGEGSPPLVFPATDDTTLIGVETDLAQLVADVLGLELELQNSSWENLFLAVKSGKYEAVFNNVTVTEERKDTYDFATYRVDQLGWQVPAASSIKEIAKPADIAGLRVSVGSGTNQEKILLDWDEQNKRAGLKPAEILYYQKYGDVLLALKSGRVQAYFGPNPSIAYNIAVSGDSRIVGTASGAGPDLQGLIAAMTKKGNGLAGPVVPLAGVTVPLPDGWEVAATVAGVQLSGENVAGRPDAEAVPLTAADVPEMLDLVGRTQPGPFLPRTIELGGYLGIRREGALVAMAGRRLRPPGWTEISAVCTDEAFRGRGLATRLVLAVAAGIRARGETPFMHAAASNTGAIRLYESLGFRLRRTATFLAVRVPEPAQGRR